jgi:hypothetical protein
MWSTGAFTRLACPDRCRQDAIKSHDAWPLWFRIRHCTAPTEYCQVQGTRSARERTRREATTTGWDMAEKRKEPRRDRQPPKKWMPGWTNISFFPTHGQWPNYAHTTWRRLDALAGRHTSLSWCILSLLLVIRGRRSCRALRGHSCHLCFSCPLPPMPCQHTLASPFDQRAGISVASWGGASADRSL